LLPAFIFSHAHFFHMYKFRAFLAVVLFSVFVLSGVFVNAQPINKLKQTNSKLLGGYISKAIAKSYGASVLMWEIDAESSARMSAQFSGVVVGKDGIVLSAAHVVMPGKTYKVMFPDGRECVAKGLGRITIPPTFMLPDAAMLKIVEKGPWPFAQMGWSSSLTVNTPCISIAYPESLEQRKPTVRFGHITLLKNKYGFLQSSCIMEPGDSGGPLFDLLGRVIGIHSGIEVPEDVNYEVPIDTYRKFWNALNKPENYVLLPADSSTVSSDPLITTIKSIPDITNLNKQLNIKGLQLQSTCAKVKSLIEGKEQQITATIISTEGIITKAALTNKTFLVSKSSMVGDTPIIVLPNGKSVKANVFSRNLNHDLVLLLADEKFGKGIKLNSPINDSIALNRLGTFFISPNPDSAARVGVLGSMLLNLPKITSYGYIGATTGIKDDKLVFTYIQPGSAAQVADLQAGDTIQTVDGYIVEDPLDFLKALQKYSAGDTTLVKITRAGKELTKKVILKYPPQKIANHPAGLFTGGKSIRRDGFNKVFVHDSAIRADECGGPLFNVQGHFVGINIARLSRTSTVAIPAFILKSLISSK
jgi:serine protease Do